MQGAQILRNEAYCSYAAMTKDEAQRRRWTFYEAVNISGTFLPKHSISFTKRLFGISSFPDSQLLQDNMVGVKIDQLVKSLKTDGKAKSCRCKARDRYASRHAKR